MLVFEVRGILLTPVQISSGNTGVTVSGKTDLIVICTENVKPVGSSVTNSKCGNLLKSVNISIVIYEIFNNSLFTVVILV